MSLKCRNTSSKRMFLFPELGWGNFMLWVPEFAGFLWISKSEICFKTRKKVVGGLSKIFQMLTASESFDSPRTTYLALLKQIFHLQIPKNLTIREPYLIELHSVVTRECRLQTWTGCREYEISWCGCFLPPGPRSSPSALRSPQLTNPSTAVDKDSEIFDRLFGIVKIRNLFQRRQKRGQRAVKKFPDARGKFLTARW